MLVLGIENFEMLSSMILVRYTCQRLNQTDFISKAKAYREPFTVELDIEIPHNQWSEIIPTIRLGSTHVIYGEVYKIIEYTSISLKSTDLAIDMIARPVYPINRKEAKVKLFSERRKKLKIEVL